MIIENPDAFKSWLTSILEPLCDADPAALAKYVYALVKKDKPLDELREVMVDQLDVFLQQETKPFVEMLFKSLESNDYLKPGREEKEPSPPPAEPEPLKKPEAENHGDSVIIYGLCVEPAPSCDADPAALAKYVYALVKKDKPLDELREVMVDQLDVFLQQETKPFVEMLFKSLESNDYLKPGREEKEPSPPPAEPEPLKKPEAENHVVPNSGPASPAAGPEPAPGSRPRLVLQPSARHAHTEHTLIKVVPLTELLEEPVDQPPRRRDRRGDSTRDADRRRRRSRSWERRARTRRHPRDNEHNNDTRRRPLSRSPSPRGRYRNRSPPPPPPIDRQNSRSRSRSPTVRDRDHERERERLRVPRELERDRMSRDREHRDRVSRSRDRERLTKGYRVAQVVPLTELLEEPVDQPPRRRDRRGDSTRDADRRRRRSRSWERRARTRRHPRDNEHNNDARRRPLSRSPSPRGRYRNRSPPPPPPIDRQNSRSRYVYGILF
ncbi:hypothetical protein B5X24_HaOG215010 [Helicoverpa armigera]|uniref:PWI domain-containing protein n=1 Tax=Helicoverpa armigera TaxID=29058 RepID=A0A2W1B9F3_HELAM|nr:hypothetical protein B5X24_HaOG215010 [Helicoverpa armigera]